MVEQQLMKNLERKLNHTSLRKRQDKQVTLVDLGNEYSEVPGLKQLIDFETHLDTANANNISNSELLGQTMPLEKGFKSYIGVLPDDERIERQDSDDSSLEDNPSNYLDAKINPVMRDYIQRGLGDNDFQCIDIKTHKTPKFRDQNNSRQSNSRSSQSQYSASANFQNLPTILTIGKQGLAIMSKKSRKGTHNTDDGYEMLKEQCMYNHKELEKRGHMSPGQLVQYIQSLIQKNKQDAYLKALARRRSGTANTLTDQQQSLRIDSQTLVNQQRKLSQGREGEDDIETKAYIVSPIKKQATLHIQNMDFNNGQRRRGEKDKQHRFTQARSSSLRKDMEEYQKMMIVSSTQSSEDQNESTAVMAPRQSLPDAFHRQHQMYQSQKSQGLTPSINGQPVAPSVTKMQVTQLKNKQFKIPNLNNSFVPIVIDDKTKMIGMPSITGNALFKTQNDPQQRFKYEQGRFDQSSRQAALGQKSQGSSRTPINNKLHRKGIISLETKLATVSDYTPNEQFTVTNGFNSATPNNDDLKSDLKLQDQSTSTGEAQQPTDETGQPQKNSNYMVRLVKHPQSSQEQINYKDPFIRLKPYGKQMYKNQSQADSSRMNNYFKQPMNSSMQIKPSNGRAITNQVPNQKSKQISSRQVPNSRSGETSRQRGSQLGFFQNKLQQRDGYKYQRNSSQPRVNTQDDRRDTIGSDSYQKEERHSSFFTSRATNNTHIDRNISSPPKPQFNSSKKAINNQKIIAQLQKNFLDQQRSSSQTFNQFLKENMPLLNGGQARNSSMQDYTGNGSQGGNAVMSLNDGHHSVISSMKDGYPIREIYKSTKTPITTGGSKLNEDLSSGVNSQNLFKGMDAVSTMIENRRQTFNNGHSRDHQTQFNAITKESNLSGLTGKPNYHSQNNDWQDEKRSLRYSKGKNLTGSKSKDLQEEGSPRVRKVRAQQLPQKKGKVVASVLENKLTQDQHEGQRHVKAASVVVPNQNTGQFTPWQSVSKQTKPLLSDVSLSGYNAQEGQMSTGRDGPSLAEQGIVKGQSVVEKHQREQAQTQREVVAQSHDERNQQNSAISQKKHSGTRVVYASRKGSLTPIKQFISCETLSEAGEVVSKSGGVTTMNQPTATMSSQNNQILVDRNNQELQVNQGLVNFSRLLKRKESKPKKIKHNINSDRR